MESVEATLTVAALNDADRALTNLELDDEAFTSAVDAARSAINAARALAFRLQ